MRDSWEHRGLVDWRLAKGQPVSSVAYRRPPNREAWRDDIKQLDLWKAAQTLPDISNVSDLEIPHALRLDICREQLAQSSRGIEPATGERR